MLSAGRVLAIPLSLPHTITITSSDESNQPCRFCCMEHVADPDNLDGWRDHLLALHGYRVESNRPGNGLEPRAIDFVLVGWSERAKFQPNARVDVNDRAPGDYSERRGDRRSRSREA